MVCMDNVNEVRDDVRACIEVLPGENASASRRAASRSSLCNSDGKTPMLAQKQPSHGRDCMIKDLDFLEQDDVSVSKSVNVLHK